MSKKLNIFWFRRDLRLHDNCGLYHALKEGIPVLPIFIFDTHILDELEDPEDPRVSFIHKALASLHSQLRALGSQMNVFYGKPEEIWVDISKKYHIGSVFTNRDYEPYASHRDGKVKKLLDELNIPFRTFKDHVLLEAGEVVKADGKPYTVFTPYKRKWMQEVETGSQFEAYPSYELSGNFYQVSQPAAILSLDQMGFKETRLSFPPMEIPRGRIKNYDVTRDYPAMEGTSRLGIHYRFGTISIRSKAKKAKELNQTYLNELIWRDFYAQILASFPSVVSQAFKPAYDRIVWHNDPDAFKKWCLGQTGYPLVDAGMRELNATGYMHNRVRMVTASFLTKHLLIDWRWGEAYFAKKLLDFDLASNNGGWQWAAGCGTDAAPYFRIFNPVSQQQKFDRDFKYVKKWVSEFGTGDYPDPMVDHKFARNRCLEVYKAALRGD